MAPLKSEYDCIVVGGGPSGSTTAALVAEAGFRVLLLERDAEPRRKVGESLMPETYWVFERLGVLEGMKRSDFVEKVGVQFVSSSGRESSPFIFTRHDPRECGRTWHVERARFDQFLLELVQRCSQDRDSLHYRCRGDVSYGRLLVDGQTSPAL